MTGDARRAREQFERVVAGAPVDASVFVGLAYACRSLGDATAALAAAERALGLEPRNLRALLLKGDALAAGGDVTTATAYYNEVVGLADRGAAMPEDLKREVERARAQLASTASGFEALLRERLQGAGLEQPAAARFRESLEILFGRQPVQLQQPRFYYMPGMPQRPFYDRSLFPWLADLEAAAGAIRSEAEAVLADPSAFRPYVERNPTLPHRRQDGMLENPDWSAFYLWKNGELVAANAARCPATLAALEGLPIVRSPNRSPSILFSLLRPGAHIPPHNGLVNTRLIGHLPLIVPPACRFRVGNEIREWAEGQAWVFDDTIEHEAWNASDRLRVILIFEVWQPELSDTERSLVNAMFAAIDAQAGRRPEWEI